MKCKEHYTELKHYLLMEDLIHDYNDTDYGLQAVKGKKQEILCKTITDSDYIDGIALIANTPCQAESLLHSQKRAAGGVGLYVNSAKQSTCVLIKEATSPN